MPISSGEPAAAGADLNAALNALQVNLAAGQPAQPVAPLPQQPFAAFYHS